MLEITNDCCGSLGESEVFRGIATDYCGSLGESELILSTRVLLLFYLLFLENGTC